MKLPRFSSAMVVVVDIRLFRRARQLCAIRRQCINRNDAINAQ